MFGYLVTNYDVKLPEGAVGRSKNEHIGAAVIPKRDAKIMIRLRKEEVA